MLSILILNSSELPYRLYCPALIIFTHLAEGEEALCVRETDESACGKVEVYLFEINLKATVGKAGEELGELYLLVLTEDILHVKDAGFTLAMVFLTPLLVFIIQVLQKISN